jgi:hypothetical protein
VTVNGYDFPPHKRVTVAWSLSTGSVVAKTNSQGQFVATLTILIPDVLGPRSAVADGYRARAAFLVVPGSTQPGGSDADPIFRTEGP